MKNPFPHTHVQLDGDTFMMGRVHITSRGEEFDCNRCGREVDWMPCPIYGHAYGYYLGGATVENGKVYEPDLIDCRWYCSRGCLEADIEELKRL